MSPTSRLTGRDRWVAVAAVAALIVLAYEVVYLTGGTKYAFLHVAYIPILLAAYWFRIAGGVLAALAVGVAMGPLMPLDTATGQAQPMVSYAARIGFLTGVGLVAGVLFQAVRRQAVRLQEEAATDEYTGLPNRTALIADCRDAMADRAGDGREIALILIDIVGEQAVLEHFGPETQDLLVRDAARRLGNALPAEGRIYRARSTGVAILATDCGIAEAERWVRTINAALEKPVTIGDVPILVEARTGLAVAPHHASDHSALLRAALTALRMAERDGRRSAAFEPARQEEHREAFGLLSDLRSALDSNDQISVAFQPKVAIEGAGCLGAEALIRWRHPERGAVPPGLFIPAAEQSALIGPLTAKVCDMAFAAAARWPESMSIAINVSARSLTDDDFPGDFWSAALRHGVEPERIELEVTESALMNDPEAAIDVLNRFAEMGFRIAIDDFGTGHSSLAYLKSLPVHVLKIDREFVKNLESDPQDQAIVRSALAIAREMSLETVAEGVETLAGAEVLREMGCKVAQGYYYAKPMSLPEFDDWASRRIAAIAV